MRVCDLAAALLRQSNVEVISSAQPRLLDRLVELAHVKSATLAESRRVVLDCLIHQPGQLHYEPHTFENHGLVHSFWLPGSKRDPVRLLAHIKAPILKTITREKDYGPGDRVRCNNEESAHHGKMATVIHPPSDSHLSGFIWIVIDGHRYGLAWLPQNLLDENGIRE
jgi:hypothetical protein